MQQLSKKKRRPFIAISVACCLVLGLVLIVLAFSQNKMSLLGQIIADAKDNEPEITISEKQSPVQDVQLISETYELNNTTYEIEYPQSKEETFNHLMMEYIEDEKDLFLTLSEKAEETEKNHLSITAIINKYNDRYYSVSFHSHTDLNNEESYESIETFVYDLNTAKTVSLQNLLDDNKRYLLTLNDYVYKQLISNDSLKEHLLDEEALQKVLTPVWDHYSNFAIEDNQLVIYFEPGTVTSHSNTVVSVKGDMSYLQSILAEPFHSKLTENTETLPLYVDHLKRVALTFDDGPHPKVTQQILNVLDEFDVKATFFMLGKNIENYPDVAQDVFNRGHEIGNHTWSHPLLTKLSLEEVKSEYERTEILIKDTFGQHSTVFRPPFGATNNDIEQLVATSSVNWSLDTLDWKHRNAKKSVQIVKNTIHNNAIILMHDIHQPTADSLREMIQFLQSEGYEMLPLSELMPYVDYHM